MRDSINFRPTTIFLKANYLNKKRKQLSKALGRKKGESESAGQDATTLISKENWENIFSDLALSRSSDQHAEVGVYMYFHATRKGMLLPSVNAAVLSAIARELHGDLPSIRKFCLVCCHLAVPEETSIDLGDGLYKSQLTDVCDAARLPGVMFASWKVAISTITDQDLTGVFDVMPSFLEQSVYVPSSGDRFILAEKGTKQPALGGKAILKDTGVANYLTPISDEDRSLVKVIVKWDGDRVVPVPLSEWHDA